MLAGWFIQSMAYIFLPFRVNTSFLFMLPEFHTLIVFVLGQSSVRAFPEHPTSRKSLLASGS